MNGVIFFRGVHFLQEEFSFWERSRLFARRADFLGEESCFGREVVVLGEDSFLRKSRLVARSSLFLGNLFVRSLRFGEESPFCMESHPFVRRLVFFGEELSFWKKGDFFCEWSFWKSSDFFCEWSFC